MFYIRSVIFCHITLCNNYKTSVTSKSKHLFHKFVGISWSWWVGLGSPPAMLKQVLLVIQDIQAALLILAGLPHVSGNCLPVSLEYLHLRPLWILGSTPHVSASSQEFFSQRWPWCQCRDKNIVGTQCKDKNIGPCLLTSHCLSPMAELRIKGQKNCLVCVENTCKVSW